MPAGSCFGGKLEVCPWATTPPTSTVEKEGIIGLNCHASSIGFSQQARAEPNWQSRGRAQVGAKVQARKSTHKTIHSFEKLSQEKKFEYFLKWWDAYPAQTAKAELVLPFLAGTPLRTIDRTRDTQRE